MSNFVNTVDSLGDEVVAKTIIDRSITEFNDDSILTIEVYAFNSCASLTSINLPNATTIGNNVFSDCIKLTSVDLPNVTSIGGGTFTSCSSLTSITIPKVKTLNGNMFIDCSSLTSLDLASATSIGPSAFQRCSKLATIILRSPTVCKLGNVNAFTGTPFSADGSGGTIYVPEALIESYQTASNWSTLYAAGTCNFVAIEGSDYE